MNVMEALLKRRSIRKYKSDKISKDNIKTILRAAMYAPSAKNAQPWKFVVVEDRKILDEIAERHPFCRFARFASLAIVTCYDEDLEFKVDGGEYGVQDAAAATQNMLLAATELDLGSCWCGVAPDPAKIDMCQDLLELPKNIIPFSITVIGEVEGDYPTTGERYDEDKVIWK